MRNGNGGPASLLSAEATDQMRSEVTIEPQSRVVVIQQWESRLALAPNRVVIPFDTLKVLGAQATLVDAGVLQVGPATGGGLPSLVV